LKQKKQGQKGAGLVAPRAGAWIETKKDITENGYDSRAPRGRVD